MDLLGFNWLVTPKPVLTLILRATSREYTMRRVCRAWRDAIAPPRLLPNLRGYQSDDWLALPIARVVNEVTGNLGLIECAHAHMRGHEKDELMEINVAAFLVSMAKLAFEDPSSRSVSHHRLSSPILVCRADYASIWAPLPVNDVIHGILYAIISALIPCSTAVAGYEYVVPWVLYMYGRDPGAYVSRTSENMLSVLRSARPVPFVQTQEAAGYCIYSDATC